MSPYRKGAERPIEDGDMQELRERLMAGTVRVGDCIQKASWRDDTYQYIGWNGAPRRAHRLAYVAWHGAIPPGMFVCHRCDNKRCINPEHLFLGTRRDNSHDMFRKGAGRPRGGGSLCPCDVLEIRKLLADGRLSQREIGDLFDVFQATISGIKRGVTWAYVTHEHARMCKQHHGQPETRLWAYRGEE